MKKSRNILCLTTATAFWGLSVVSQSLGNATMGPCTFNVARFIVSVIAMIPYLVFIARRERAEGRPSPLAKRGELLRGGIITGAALFWSINLQQLCLLYLPAGKAIFITSLYMIIVPAVDWLRGRRGTMWLWFGVALSVVGLWLLCMQDSLALSKGELIALGSACGYTVHIMCLDHFSPKLECFFYSEVQFITVAILSSVVMFLFETPDWNGVVRGWMPLAYSGIVAGALAYSLQTVGQRNFDTAIASLILSTETVFCVLGAWAILGEVLSLREIAGCTLMFSAVIVAQVPALMHRS